MFRIMWFQEWLYSAGVLWFYSITITCLHWVITVVTTHFTIAFQKYSRICNLRKVIKTFPSQRTSTRIFWACSTCAFFIYLLLLLFFLRSWGYTLVKILATLAEVFCCSSQPVQVNPRIEPHIWPHIHLSCWVIICHDLSTTNKCL